jgi:hypothetical protein
MPALTRRDTGARWSTMKLKLTNGDDYRAVLLIDDDREKMVVVRCPDSVRVAKEIAKAVNRDFLFDPMVAALTPFKSREMGQLLITMFSDEDTATQLARQRLAGLIDTIDVLLKGVELNSKA